MSEKLEDRFSGKEDLTGNRYGILLVLQRVSNVKGRKVYKCLCECGKEPVILGQSLKKGVTQSCGCVQKADPPSTKNLEGMRFGKWLVIKRVRKKGSDGAMFECQCECGARRTIPAYSLKRGASQSCGKCGAYKKQFCLKGHDTSILGRTSSDTCRACMREKRLKTLYGITLDEYKEIWEAQHGKCAICETPLQAPDDIGKPGWGNGIRVEVDHDHAKNLTPRQAVRGLLCGGRWKGCNRRLGNIDNMHWLRRAAEYLENPPAQTLIKIKQENNGKP